MPIATLIVVTLPLFFSHLFSRWGLDLIDGMFFERMKVYLFLGLVILFLFETLFSRSDRLVGVLKKYGWTLSILLLLPLIAMYLSPEPLYGIIGTYEKHHGYLWWGALVLYGLLISTLEDRRPLLAISVYTAGVVTLIGICEYAGYHISDILSRPLSGDDIRIISTLGNPNYLAGYLLIHIPLISSLREKYQRYLILPLIIVAIILTGSYIGIGLMMVYGCIILARTYSRYGALIVIILSISLSLIGWRYIPEGKKLSFETRGVLIEETIVRLGDSPERALLGYGPDSIMKLYSTPRSETIRSYIPDTHVIDSSHSILIDLLYSYGAIIFCIIGYMAFTRYALLDTRARDGLMLGIVFFSMNVIVLAPLIVMILLSQMEKNH